MKAPPALRQQYRRARIAAAHLLGTPLNEKLKFLAAHRRWPCIRAAETFSEKVLVRKLYWDDARFPILADKIAVREWVAQRIGSEHLIPVAGTYDYEDLDRLELLPDHVIKCANRSGGVYFVREGREVDRGQLIRSLRRDLDFGFSAWSGESWYGDIPKRVIVERLLTTGGSIPCDYKFLVFNGAVRVIQVDIDRFTAHRRALFDRDWEFVPVRLSVASHPTLPPKQLPRRPQCFDRMLEIAETLGRELDFVRVDLYEIDGKRVYFGEMTLAPASGLGRFDPDGYDRKLGGFWRQPAPARSSGEADRIRRLLASAALETGAQDPHSRLRRNG